MALGSPLDSNLAVEFGMKDDEFGALKLWVSVIAAACMVLGGWLSDRLGRRRMLALYVAGMSLPVLYMVWVLQSHGYVMPRPPGGPPLAELSRALWIASLTYAVFAGLMYATRVAILMDVTNPRVAATQFTAYTAMVNFAIAFAAGWHGLAIEAWGYPITLMVDAIAGLLCLLFVPAMKPVATFADGHAGRRARRSALALGIACLSWLLYWPNHALLGKAHTVVGSFYTLVFVASALFLLAGREVLGDAGGRWRRAAPWMALLLLALHARYWLDALATQPALGSLAQGLLYAVPLAGGAMLLALATRDWTMDDVTEPPLAAPAAVPP